MSKFCARALNAPDFIQLKNYVFKGFVQIGLFDKMNPKRFHLAVAHIQYWFVQCQIKIIKLTSFKNCDSINEKEGG